MPRRLVIVRYPERIPGPEQPAERLRLVDEHRQKSESTPPAQAGDGQKRSILYILSIPVSPLPQENQRRRPQQQGVCEPDGRPGPDADSQQPPHPRRPPALHQADEQPRGQGHRQHRRRLAHHRPSRIDRRPTGQRQQARGHARRPAPDPLPRAVGQRCRQPNKRQGAEDRVGQRRPEQPVKRHDQQRIPEEVARRPHGLSYGEGVGPCNHQPPGGDRVFGGVRRGPQVRDQIRIDVDPDDGVPEDQPGEDPPRPRMGVEPAEPVPERRASHGPRRQEATCPHEDQPDPHGPEQRPCPGLHDSVRTGVARNQAGQSCAQDERRDASGGQTERRKLSMG